MTGASYLHRWVLQRSYYVVAVRGTALAAYTTVVVPCYERENPDPSHLKIVVFTVPSPTPIALTCLKMAESNPHTFMTPTFLTLPIELRLQIYSQVFADSRIRLPLSPEHDRRNKDLIRGEKSQPHHLHFVCRQIYLEAHPLFYGTVTWHFLHQDALDSFFRPREDQQRQQRIRWIKHIRLSCVDMLELIPFPELTALKRVEIQVDGDAYFNYADGGGAMFDVQLSVGELSSLARETVRETLAAASECVRDVYESLRCQRKLSVLFLVDHTFCGKIGLRRIVSWTKAPNSLGVQFVCWPEACAE